MLGIEENTETEDRGKRSKWASLIVCKQVEDFPAWKKYFEKITAPNKQIGEKNKGCRRYKGNAFDM